ncbi:fructose-6-phosphate aldolase [Candidatus Bathyarchaeota archaeon]|nr:fructose-6-phosphate aldolase [Candidatus Bathyarchaeota archaeon]
MEIFIDTAEISQIKKYWNMGVIDGVTTNPTLIAKSGRDFKQVVAEIADIVKGPISVEAISTQASDLIAEAKELVKFGEYIVVKIPMTAEGLKAVKELNKLGIKTNVTLVFSASQALLAAKAGATYVSIFVGRLDDRGHEGMEVVYEIGEIFKNYRLPSKLIVASIRHPRHVIEAATAGADVATIPPDTLDKMLAHPLTDEGLRVFASDWEKVKKT